jgi:hypothetical protein
MGVGGQHHAPAAFTPGKDPVPIVQEAGWAPGLVWTGAENLTPPGFDPQTVRPRASRYTDYTVPFFVELLVIYCESNEKCAKLNTIHAHVSVEFREEGSFML